MKKLLLTILLILIGAIDASAQTTAVTGNLRDVLGGSLSSNAFVRIRLRNFDPNSPRGTGTAPCIGPIVKTSKDVLPDGSGNIVTTVCGNNIITPSGTYYTLEFWDNGRKQHEASFLVTSGGPLDFNTAAPITTVPVVVPPTGDTTYLRTDGGNQMAGNIIPNAVDSRTLGNSFARFDAILDDVTVGKQNNILFVDGVKYTTTDIGATLNTMYAALPSSGGKIVIPCKTDGSDYDFSTPIVFSSASGKNLRIQADCVGNSASTGGVVLNYTPTTATAAMTVDVTPAGGGGYNPAFIMDGVILINNACGTNGGCGSSATGIKFGGTNGGAHLALLTNGRVGGFSKNIDLADTGGIGWGIMLSQFSLSHAPTGMKFTTLHENIKWHGGSCYTVTTCIDMPNASLLGAVGVSFGPGAYSGSGNFNCSQCWFENLGALANANYVTATAGTVHIAGGFALDDETSGTTAQMFTLTDAQLTVNGLSVFSLGRTITNAFNLSGGAGVTGSYVTTSAALIPSSCNTPNGCSAVRLVPGAFHEVDTLTFSNLLRLKNAKELQIADSGGTYRTTLLMDGGNNTILRGYTGGLYLQDSTGASVATITPGLFKAIAYGTNTNCSSSAAPAACSAAPAGSVVIAASATTVTVNTTAVTANSQIILQRDNSLGTKLSVTCNTQSSLVLGQPYVSARTAATSFVITLDVAPTTNPMCISYMIVN